MCNLLDRQVKPHKIQTQELHVERLMMSGKDRVGQIIKTSVTVVTLITLTGGFRIITATLDGMVRLTRGARDAIGPSQLANGLITLDIINEILDVALHDWTPMRDRGMG